MTHQDLDMKNSAGVRLIREALEEGGTIGRREVKYLLQRFDEAAKYRDILRDAVMRDLIAAGHDACLPGLLVTGEKPCRFCAVLDLDAIANIYEARHGVRPSLEMLDVTKEDGDGQD